MKNDVILDVYSEDDLQEPDQIYLYAKYVAKDKLSEIVEQRLYVSVRHIYFYCKFLIDNHKPAPEHLHNFMLASYGAELEKESESFLKKFFELDKKTQSSL